MLRKLIQRETATQLETFALYRDLGPRRSLRKLRATWGQNGGNTSLSEAPSQSTLERWSTSFQWQERCDTYDMTVAQKEEAARMEIRVAQAREDEAIRAELIHGAQCILANIIWRQSWEENPGALRERHELGQHELRAIPELLKVTSTLQRLEAGEATTRTESRDAVDPAVNKKAVIVAMTREQQDEFYARFQDFARRIQPRTLKDSEPR